MRASGVLLPISSIPSEYGIGGFSKEAYAFVDALEKAEQSYWQILPLGPTGYGDSPYQSFSTFAGNPYFIDLEEFIKEGWLTDEQCREREFQGHPNYVDYDKIYATRWDLLKLAYSNSNIGEEEAFQAFCKENASWLDDYALYTVLKSAQGGKSWIEWDECYRNKEKDKLDEFAEEYAEEIEFQKFMQYEFFIQWTKLKEYANKKGIKIIGDIPIYVAFDGADSWGNPELFQFDEKGYPVGVAGCPPDAFSATGQLWGNPLYDWEYHKKSEYAWWVERVRHCSRLYDVIRIDHFRGFDEYYSIPYGDETAEFGHWEAGPGMELFEKIKSELGEIEIIAEDLGFLTDTVLKLVKDSGYPGMKVLQFAFDPSGDSDYLPHNHIKNCVVYTGTHDNETLTGWYYAQSDETIEFVKKYMGLTNANDSDIIWGIIRMAFASVADTCILPLQDYLGLGNEARMNHPSTMGNNWKWRMGKDDLKEDVIQKILDLTRLYKRSPK